MGRPRCPGRDSENRSRKVGSKITNLHAEQVHALPCPLHPLHLWGGLFSGENELERPHTPETQGQQDEAPHQIRQIQRSPAYEG